MPVRSQNRRRYGLTLMELVVVLTILVGLAAILVPLFPNLLRRTHKATDATQTAEVAKAVQLYQATYLSYPDQFDLMTTGTSTTAPDFLPAETPGSTPPFGGGAQIGNLTQLEVDALSRVGIKSGHQFVASAPAQATQNPYSGPITPPTPLSITVPVFIIQAGSGGTVPAKVPVEIQNIIARDPSARFVVFGLGSRCTMVGTTIQNAPTSVPQNSGFTPATLYSRIGVIFQVAGVGVNATERARFVASAALEDDEIESTEKDIVGYYDVAKSGQ